VHPFTLGSSLAGIESGAFERAPPRDGAKVAVEDEILKSEFMVAEPEELESLLSAGQWGHHLLFSNEQISRAFGNAEHRLGNLGQATLEGVNKALASLVSQSHSLLEKRSLVEELPEEVRSIIIFLYFRILDQRMEKKAPTVH